MGDRARGGLDVALLFVFCGLDALTRSSPFGQLIASGIACCFVLGGLVAMVVVLATADWSEDSETGDSNSNGNGTSTSTNLYISHHTPTDASTETWWTSFVVIGAAALLLSLPLLWYLPVYAWCPERRTQPTLREKGPERPLLALPEKDGIVQV